MAIHRIEDVTPQVLDKGLRELQGSGFTVEGNRVTGMGVDATFELAANVLTVNLEKAPPLLGDMVEKQLRSFFS
jgi:hypothetical protein